MKASAAPVRRDVTAACTRSGPLEASLRRAAAAAAAAAVPSRFAAPTSAGPKDADVAPPPASAAAPVLPHQRVAAAALAAAVSVACALGPGAGAAAAFAPPWCRDPLGIWALPLVPSELPAVRPPPWPAVCPSDKGGDASACAVRAATLEARPNGALVATVAHRPLRGVAPEALRWWFEGGVEGEMTHPLDGRTYSRYLVWHPRDHVAQTTLLRGPAAGRAEGALWLLREFFGSAAPGGWVSSDGARDGGCAWAGECYAKAPLKVKALDDAGLRLAFDLPSLPLGQRQQEKELAAVNLVHAWRGTPEGLELVSTLTVGVPDGDGWAARAVNRAARRAFGGADAERCVAAWQRHCAEEFANLARFLPALHAAEAGAGGTGAGAAAAAAAFEGAAAELRGGGGGGEGGTV